MNHGSDQDKTELGMIFDLIRQKRDQSDSSSGRRLEVLGASSSKGQAHGPLFEGKGTCQAVCYSRFNKLRVLSFCLPTDGPLVSRRVSFTSPSVRLRHSLVQLQLERIRQIEVAIMNIFRLLGML